MATLVNYTCKSFIKLTPGLCFLDVNPPISLTCACRQKADAVMLHHRGENGDIICIFSYVFVECLGLSSAHMSDIIFDQSACTIFSRSQALAAACRPQINN